MSVGPIRMLILIGLSATGRANGFEDNKPSERARPEPLLAVEAGRSKLRTGEVSWSEQVEGKRGPLHYFARFADDSFTYVHRGDDNGVVHRDAEGKPLEGLSFTGSMNWLFLAGEAWSHTERDITANKYLGETPPLSGLDVRGLGLTSTVPLDASTWQDTLWKYGGKIPVPARFSCTRDGKLHVVTAALERDWEHEWSIDPDRGWNPIRVVTRKKGSSGFWAEMKCTLRKYDQVWFPDVIVYSGGSPVRKRTIRIESCRFNRTDQPRVLGPRDIGIESGTNVHVIEDWLSGKITPESEAGLSWNGDQVVSRAELKEQVRSGDVKIGPTLVVESNRLGREQRARHSAEKERNNAVIHETAFRVPNSWEKYVQLVSALCSFSANQRVSADSILKDVLQRAIGKGPEAHAVLFSELKTRLEHIMTPDQSRIARDRIPKAITTTAPAR
jgi:hypothetical protein